MRRAVLILWAAGLAAGCGEYAGPSGPSNVYALARIGSAHPPISLNGDGTAPFLLADTLRLLQDRARTDQQVLRHIIVLQQQPNGSRTRSESEHAYQIAGTTLSYDECPIEALCAASLVYSPRIFQIVGDSLFEVTPVGANIPPHVYGLVRYR